MNSPPKKEKKTGSLIVLAHSVCVLPFLCHLACSEKIITLKSRSTLDIDCSQKSAALNLSSDLWPLGVYTSWQVKQMLTTE